jgi:hypothetical protein
MEGNAHHGLTGSTGPDCSCNDSEEECCTKVKVQVTGCRGPRGCTGATGEQGPKGDQGATGEQGPKGDQGATGEQGPKGDQGATGEQGPKGDQGATGAQGATGEQGPKGDQGATGEQGPQGATGEQGATGPCCPFSHTFIHLDRETDQFLKQEESVLWDKNAIIYGDCGHISGQDGWYVWRPGFYHVYYNLYHQEPCQFTLFKNGLPLPGSTTGSPTGASQNSSALIIEVTSADFITPFSGAPGGVAAEFKLTNHTSFVPLVLLNGLSGSGSATPQITATMTMFLLTDTTSM